MLSRVLLLSALFWAGLGGSGFTVRAMERADTKLTTEKGFESPSLFNQSVPELWSRLNRCFKQREQGAHHIPNATCSPVQINRESIQPTESIGIATAANITEGPAHLYPNFDVALYHSHALDYSPARARCQYQKVLVPEQSANRKEGTG